MSSTDVDAMWDQAVSKYEHVTKKKLNDLPRPHSAEDLIQQIQNANSQYESFREKSGIVYKILSAFAEPIELVGKLAAGAASAAFPPSSMIFGAVMYLIQAAKGVSKILDAICDLMAGLQNFSIRLRVYEKAHLSEALRDKLTQILVTVIEILAKSTRKVKDRYFRIRTYAQNMICGSDTEIPGLLRKLDILTQSENLLVSAETYVEAKSTGKGVQALQVSMTAMQVTANESSQGIADIKAALDESSAQLRVEKIHSQLEALKKVLGPSVTAQERFEQIKRERRLVPHSGDWILAEEHFNNWIAYNERPLLWITGSPGSGKSFLTYNLITYLHDHSNDQSDSAPHDTAVGFFFFRDNSTVTQSFRQALCDVAYQFTHSDPAYTKYLNTTGLDAADLSSVGLAWKVLFEDYWLSGKAPNVAYIVLDGLDEASSQERETFIELLKGVEELGAKSGLRVAMLGRPHIVQEMTLLGLREPPTIYVDSSKNGADIAVYVRSSITKSQALRRVSRKLQLKIIEALTAKAGGMFMWAKLMIAELNRKAQRSREPEVERVLNEAPKGLTEMIQHVLESFAISLPPDEADDLNAMLMWVALARRPLYLGELDAALRLKCEDGSGLVFLEGMLRKTYASLFSLSREDGMTTSELLVHNQSPNYDENEDLELRDAAPDGEEDLDYPTELNSNPGTTTVSFSHASISDYFLNPKHSKVIDSGGGTIIVGMDLEAAKLAASEACINIIVDQAYRSRMEGAVSLLPYAQKNWFEHLQDVKRESLNEEARLTIGKKLARMLFDEKDVGQWAGTRNALFWTSHVADCLTSWFKDPVVLDQLASGTREWLNTISKDSSTEVFDRPMRYVAKQWVGVPISTWNAKNCPQVVHCWLARRQGKIVDEIPILTAEDILKAAQFGGFDENAEFHRRLAMSLREHGHYEEAKQRFEQALTLDPSMWLARAGLSMSHVLQEDYRRALDIDEVVASTLEASPEKESATTQASLNVIYKRMADCYGGIADQIEEFPSEVALELDLKACQYYFKAFQARKNDFASASLYVNYWQEWASLSLPFKTKSVYANPSDVPAPDQCFKEIVSIAHEMEEANMDESTHWLWNTEVDVNDFENALAMAAKETNELQWLQERYSEAISKAHRALKPTMSAAMVLSLANLSDVYVDNGEKALELWESLVSERVFVTREDTEIVYIQQEALENLGMYCLRKALEDESQSDRYIGKLEKIWQRRSRRVAFLSEEAVPPSNFALCLGSWYTKVGRHEEALEVVKAHVREALVVLNDDDPTNDMEGHMNLAFALLAVRDDKNVTALMHSLRKFRDGVAILASDSQSDKGSGSELLLRNDSSETRQEDMTVETGQDDDNDPMDEHDVCDGPCDAEFDSYDNIFICRYDMFTFCPDCHTKLCETGSLPSLKCSGSHEFLEIEPLTTRFKRGEIVVNEAVVDFTSWKKDVAAKWGL